MARSDDSRDRTRRWTRPALLVGAALVAAGCSTTQDEAARVQLNDARIRAAQVHTVVRTAGARVRVSRVALVASPGAGSEILVTVRNPGRRTVVDLPISVGVRLPRRGRVDLNAVSTQELSYFDAHLPALAPGQTLTWVYATPRRLAASDRPFALVGRRPDPALNRAGRGSAPRITARVVSRAPTGPNRGRLMVSLHNTSSVPQYQMPVYATGRRAGREVAAGTLVVPHLGSHATLTLPLPVVGALAHARLALAAVPTIFQ